MNEEISIIANTVIRKSALPDFSLAPDDFADSVRISAFDKLNGAFERYVGGWSNQYMNVFRHHDEGVQMESSFSTVSIYGFHEQANIIFNNE